MTNNLSVYLNDHLAGATAGLEILDRLCDLLKDTEFADDIKAVRDEVAEDREALEHLIDRLGFSESTIRKASGWLAEKAATLKMIVDDPRSGPFRTFESLEAIELGIQGKCLLWKALSASVIYQTGVDPEELQTLIERADDQRRRVETMRLNVAQKALVSAE
jgi:hypothetical protein